MNFKTCIILRSQKKEFEYFKKRVFSEGDLSYWQNNFNSKSWENDPFVWLIYLENYRFPLACSFSTYVNIFENKAEAEIHFLTVDSIRNSIIPPILFSSVLTVWFEYYKIFLLYSKTHKKAQKAENIIKKSGFSFYGFDNSFDKIWCLKKDEWEKNIFWKKIRTKVNVTFKF